MSRERHYAPCPDCGRTYAPRSADIARLIKADGCGQCVAGLTPREDRTGKDGVAVPPRTYYDEYHGHTKGEATR